MAISGTRRSKTPLWVSIFCSVWASVFLFATLSVPFLAKEWGWTFDQIVKAGGFTVVTAFALLVAAGFLSPAAFKTIVGSFMPQGGKAK